DLSFTGELLASADSRWDAGREQNRWTEIEVYRTDSELYVVAIQGRTLWQGEHDRHAATVCDSPEEVYKALTLEGCQDDEGERRLSWLAKEVLEELA
ncbi:MAG: hypothetical protein M1335_04960, partial [Chloroflexi bacterium]|nr:hypothetical protein [Chloroflexota bacterium]